VGYRLGYLAVWMLNAAIRPVLGHAELLGWEATTRRTTSDGVQ
jgi:hypothetical protein